MLAVVTTQLSKWSNPIIIISNHGNWTLNGRTTEGFANQTASHIIVRSSLLNNILSTCWTYIYNQHYIHTFPIYKEENIWIKYLIKSTWNNIILRVHIVWVKKFNSKETHGNKKYNIQIKFFLQNTRTIGEVRETIKRRIQNNGISKVLL